MKAKISIQSSKGFYSWDTYRVVGKIDATSTVANCYAKGTLTVLYEDVAVTLTKGAALKAGADISAMMDTTSAPLSSWEFGEDSNGDEMARPILYFDPDGDGTFVQLGPDDGMLP